LLQPDTRRYQDRTAGKKSKRKDYGKIEETDPYKMETMLEEGDEEEGDKEEASICLFAF
jgi:hypothetical protein